MYFISTLNQGNDDYIECGTIIGGPCDGDTLWGIGIDQADNQEGCQCYGFTAIVRLVKKMWVIGKCASKCSMGWSVKTWDTPVNNWGLVRRSVEEVAEVAQKSP